MYNYKQYKSVIAEKNEHILQFCIWSYKTLLVTQGGTAEIIFYSLDSVTW